MFRAMIRITARMIATGWGFCVARASFSVETGPAALRFPQARIGGVIRIGRTVPILKPPMSIIAVAGNGLPGTIRYVCRSLAVLRRIIWFSVSAAKENPPSAAPKVMALTAPIPPMWTRRSRMDLPISARSTGFGKGWISPPRYARTRLMALMAQQRGGLVVCWRCQKSPHACGPQAALLIARRRLMNATAPQLRFTVVFAAIPICNPKTPPPGKPALKLISAKT